MFRYRKSVTTPVKKRRECNPLRAVGIDGGYVKATDAPSRQEGWLEVMVGKSLPPAGRGLTKLLPALDACRTFASRQRHLRYLNGNPRSRRQQDLPGPTGNSNPEMYVAARFSAGRLRQRSVDGFP